MTPDERADRAERVIEETIEQLRELGLHFKGDGYRDGIVAADAIELAESALERNARIAGIACKPPKAGN